jgi:hypothetical protein
MSLSIAAVMTLNVLWFGAGAWYFGVTTNSVIKGLISRSAGQSPLYPAIFAAVRFLGGLNLGFAVLAGALLFNRALFPEAAQMAVLTAVLAVAHGTQFATNVPVALSRNSQGERQWPVLRGLMLFIFLMDFALMVANGALAAFLFAA